MTTQTNVNALLEKWSNVRAFLINDQVTCDFSLDDDQGETDIAASFYIYGKRGLCAEYFVSREEIENGKAIEGGICVNYCGKPLNIIALVPQPITNTAKE